MTASALASARPSFDYIPGLDGLRACAVLLVLVAHMGFSTSIPGGFGVTVFFFISGMLITRLLLAEHAQNGRIAVGRFYVRRLFRLYPALLVAVALGALVFTLAGGIMSWGKVFASLFYYANYYGIFVHFGQGRDGFDPFSILWSLAVEEQYYLVFPFVCVALLAGTANLRRFSWVLAASVALVLLWRVILHHYGNNSVGSSDYIYMATDTRIDSILYGAWLALILANDTQKHWRRFSSSHVVQAVCLLLLLACFMLRHPGFRDTLRYSLQGLALMPLVTAICFTDKLAPLTRLLETKPARRVGNWSYSLYLYHPIAIVIAEIWWGPGSIGPQRIGWQTFPWFAATAVLLSFAFAVASYNFVEKPFLRWRRRFGAHVVAN
ncbi:MULTISPECIES: acyltransferase [unclassified Herbaspirillum]|uniref:acyltransferase family protein n=1 Tax=unclassified Herbaspirillum TaxID=2624150 RepID=UPI000E2F39BC|nr:MULTISPECIES: acyltransferase [unclassified Herbaspirillum]RFB73784.1 acyltransferase [Herbaspirillum sp. 3R-3a1]TFI10405.1 acyltransferase [Herbaspirillum sp. 3R11]TFI16310.1 acyltransferase [Herbaspirillum sp. 3R-11]TFI25728.1 acyltransferase [Herbaspirillum sp. 3C11]